MPSIHDPGNLASEWLSMNAAHDMDTETNTQCEGYAEDTKCICGLDAARADLAALFEKVRAAEQIEALAFALIDKLDALRTDDDNPTSTDTDVFDGIADEETALWQAIGSPMQGSPGFTTLQARAAAYLAPSPTT